MGLAPAGKAKTMPTLAFYIDRTSTRVFDSELATGSRAPAARTINVHKRAQHEGREFRIALGRGNSSDQSLRELALAFWTGTLQSTAPRPCLHLELHEIHGARMAEEMATRVGNHLGGVNVRVADTAQRVPRRLRVAPRLDTVSFAEHCRFSLVCIEQGQPHLVPHFVLVLKPEVLHATRIPLVHAEEDLRLVRRHAENVFKTFNALFFGCGFERRYVVGENQEGSGEGGVARGRGVGRGGELSVVKGRRRGGCNCVGGQ